MFSNNNNKLMSKRICPFCNDLIPVKNKQYSKHILEDCDKEDEVIITPTPNTFNIVIPEPTGYVWQHQCDGFACRQVLIQGTLVPLGDIQKIEYNYDEITEYDGKFEDFDNPSEARRIFKLGLQNSTNHAYGGINLGDKLIEERLDGVYTKDEEYKEQKFNTREERIQNVWDDIDDALLFQYKETEPPTGYPEPTEGLKWVIITGHTYKDLYLRYDWVEQLSQTEQKVALLYPNSD